MGRMCFHGRYWLQCAHDYVYPRFNHTIIFNDALDYDKGRY